MNNYRNYHFMQDLFIITLKGDCLLFCRASHYDKFT